MTKTSNTRASGAEKTPARKTRQARNRVAVAIAPLSPRTRALLATTALASALAVLALHPAPANAQTVPANNILAQTFSNTGSSASSPADDNQSGSAGGAGADFTIDIQTPQNIKSSLDNQDLLGVVSTGGRGQDSGQSEADLNHDGPFGGDGGGGGALTMTAEGPGSAGYSVLEATGDNANGFRLSSIGGRAGDGHDAAKTDGNGAMGGTGGDGGLLTFNMSPSTADPAWLTFVEATNGAVNLSTQGGRGGDSGDSESVGSSSVIGRKGGTGGQGGSIYANLTGNISGYNSGIGVLASSVGGDGGDGGGASAGLISLAKGSNGGDAGNGGTVYVNVDGGAVTARGPAGAATGPQQNFDSTTTDTVPLDTSITSGAIVAQSLGGLGGNGGDVNGAYTEGGNGGGAGDGGGVTVSITGPGIPASSVDSNLPASGNTVIGTNGYNTFGVMAASVGGDGGGGNAGSGAFFRKGGKGAKGGDGGSVSILADSDGGYAYPMVATSGDDSDALVALSVGGGGGYSGDLNDSSAGGGFIASVVIGGDGGDGGDAAEANVTNGYWGDPPTDGGPRVFHGGDVISTSGTFSRGIVAQSVGGGGGRGGDVTNTAPAASVVIGGAGGGGGDGGEADASNYGLINTTGSHSTGVFVQSVGGGGGSGGGALSRVIGAQVTASIAVGGKGGSGGQGQEADIYNLGQVQTQDGNAHALFAQSVGGGGGTGGTAAAENYATNLPDTPSIQVTTAVGGSGGVAGQGGNVNVLNVGLAQTQGQDAYGVFAQSVGGGGGAGGDASATAMAYQQGKIVSTTAIGGRGSGGGQGGEVNVWNSGLVSTSADTAIGVFAQSVGGGGGTGGFATTNQGAVYSAGSKSAELSLAIGGQGGAASKGGNVTVDNYVDSSVLPDRYPFGSTDIEGAGGVLTTGDMAYGVFAQSIGGGGGNGSDASGKGGNGQVSVNVAIGGGGGGGGDGGFVTVHNGSGAIQTYGAQSYGVFGQSVGGGGGTGGNAVTGGGSDPEYAYPTQAASLAASGFVNNPSDFTKVTDQIWDWKDNLKGAWDDKNRLTELYNLNTDINTAGEQKYFGLTTADLTVDVGGGAGGAGGSAGQGGSVTLDSNGSVITHGPMAHALFAQSIGGGGGVGGGAAPVTANDQLHDSAVESAIAVGGHRGKGGNGGWAVIANNPGGDIETHGDMAFGMLAQSIGGGGGVGGAAVPNAGLGNLMTVSIGADGPDAESVVGGSGSLANAYNDASITTVGNHAVGMAVQSVGGGGGMVALTGQTIDQGSGLGISNTQTLAQGVATPTLANNYLGSKNTGGPVTALINSGGTVTTSGVNAFSVLAQSVGGGGGLMIVDPNNPVTVNQLAPDPKTYAPSNGNKAGITTVTTQGQTRIATSGNGAVGIVAQSLGGAGVIVNGFDGVNLNQGSQQVVQNRWDMGMGGAVVVTNNSDIDTSGAYAHGIFAQVASGAGGVIGRTNGTGTVFRSGLGEDMACGSEQSHTSVTKGGDCGGEATVNLQAGTITVTGAHSWGVAVESENNSFWYTGDGNDYDDQSTATVNVSNAGRVLAQQNADGAILLNSTGTNTVNNSGVIDGSTSAGGYAINSVGKSYKVNNTSTGTIKGSFGSKCSGTCTDVGVGAAAPAVTIENAGLIETGAVMDLGAGQLSNHGTLSVGASGKVASTTLTGDLIQGADGVLLIDADAKTGAADHLQVSGKAVIDGQVKLASNVTSKSAPITALTAAGGVTLAQAQVAAVAAEAATPFSDDLSVSGNDLQVQTNAHFADAASSLGKGQQAVAAHLQQVWDNGASMQTAFPALRAVGDAGSYAQALNSLSGEALGAIDVVRYRTSQNFVGNMLDGCPDGLDADGRCVWGRVSDSHTTQDATKDALGYKVDGHAVQMGASAPIGSNLTLSGGLAYGDNELKGDGASKIDGEDLRGGAMLTWKSGKVELSGVLDAGHGSYDSTRNIAVGGVTATATAKPKTWDVGAHLRAAYAQPVGKDWQVKPYVDLNASHVHSKAFAETGAGEFDLHVDKDNDTVLSAAAGVEVSGDVKMGKDKAITLRPFASAAVEALDNGDWAGRARFEGQTGVDGFKASTRLPDVLGEFAVGAELAKGDKWSLRAQYGVDLGKDYTAQTGALRFGLKF